MHTITEGQLRGMGVWDDPRPQHTMLHNVHLVDRMRMEKLRLDSQAEQLNQDFVTMAAECLYRRKEQSPGLREEHFGCQHKDVTTQMFTVCKMDDCPLLK